MKLCIFHGGGGENTMTGEGNFRSAFMNDGTYTVLVGETKISTGKQYPKQQKQEGKQTKREQIFLVGHPTLVAHRSKVVATGGLGDKVTSIITQHQLHKVLTCIYLLG